MSKQPKQKYTAKDYIIALALFAAFGLIFYCIADYMSTPTDIATDAQVWAELESMGYVPYDLTQQYLDKELNCGILKNITVQDDDLRIEFFVFKSDKKAADIWAEYRSFIREKELNPGSPAGRGNRVIYYAFAQDNYYAIVRVGNTLVFAASDEENAGAVNSFLVSIGYLEPSKPSKLLSNEMMRYVIALCMELIVLLPLTRISLHWIWKLICKSAEITSKDLDLYGEETRHKFAFKYSRYGYFSQRVKNPKKFKLMYLAYKACFIPLYITLFLNFVSIFSNWSKAYTDSFALAAIFVIVGSGFLDAMYKKIYLHNK